MGSVPFGEIRAPNVLVLDLHEIIAGKLMALIDRHAMQDPPVHDDYELDRRRITGAILAITLQRDVGEFLIVYDDKSVLRHRVAPHLILAFHQLGCDGTEHLPLDPVAGGRLSVLKRTFSVAKVAG
jgi:hypothetical protein